MRGTWPAPVKINLFLHVVGRRADGYHELQTVFRFLDFGDEIEFSRRDDGRILRTIDIPGIAESDDLCLRAAHALRDWTGTRFGADIALAKRVPVGSGLGGGSSDAATTLIALNTIWELGLEQAELLVIAVGLGADVPVFVFGRSAWGEGVGDILEALTLPPGGWYVVVTPPVAVSTARVFAAFKLTPENRAITIRDFLGGGGRNDLEPVVCGLYPEVDRVLRWLRQFGAARMTGSGGSVFLAVTDRAQGQEILAARPSGCTGFVARALDVHPLADAGD